MNAVLLVDDERDFADLLAERLQARGFRVQTAYDGEEALRLAAVGELDVAVLDVNLPGIDGLALLAELKKLRPRVEALMLTGQNDLATAVAGMKLGATDYLVKPVPIERLAEAILRAQERRLERLEGLRMAETAKMAALGHMAEGVAHEINNPVNTMASLAGWLEDLVADLRQELQAAPAVQRPAFAKGLTEGALAEGGLTKHGVPEGTLSEMEQSAAKLVEQGRRCKAITAKLLCLCHKARPGSLQPQAQGGVQVDLTALLAELLEERRARMEQAGISAFPALSPDLPLLLLPQARLQQDALPGADLATALGNILDNALDAMPLGGSLWVIASAGPDTVRIEVEDSGHGIAPAHLPRVFEPFFSTREVGQGTGLGLSVSYGTLKSLGGDIEIKSRLDQGTKVLVTLPR